MRLGLEFKLWGSFIFEGWYWVLFPTRFALPPINMAPEGGYLEDEFNSSWTDRVPSRSHGTRRREGRFSGSKPSGLFLQKPRQRWTHRQGRGPDTFSSLQQGHQAKDVPPLLVVAN